MKILPRLILLGVLALTACAQPRVPDDNFYRLTLNGPEHRAVPLLSGTVEVERFIADGLFAGRAIVFSDVNQPNLAQSYHYDYWSETPSILLQNAMVDYLRKGNVATTVVTPDLHVEPDYILTGKIRMFDHIRGASGKVRAGIEITLKERKTDRLMVLKSYMVERPVANGSMTEVAQQMSAAVDEIFAKFVTDLTNS